MLRIFEHARETTASRFDREITTPSKLLLRVVKNLDPEIAAEIESMHTR
jgi:hypothetical protein